MTHDINKLREAITRDFNEATFPDDGRDILALICEALWSEDCKDWATADGYHLPHEPTLGELLQQRLAEGAQIPPHLLRPSSREGR